MSRLCATLCVCVSRVSTFGLLGAMEPGLATMISGAMYRGELDGERHHDHSLSDAPLCISYVPNGEADIFAIACHVVDSIIV